MDTKLTLNLNRDVVENAKQYAAVRRLSLSRLVEDYLQSLPHSSKSKSIRISPFVQSMSSETSIPLDLDYKKEYADFLTLKYK